MGLLQSHRGVEEAGPTRKRNAFPGASPSLLHEAPAWIPKTRARVTKCREGQPLLSLWPYPHSIPRGSVLFPALPRGAVRRTARPLASLGLGFPLYKEESGEMVSRSLQAPTRQDFLPQWMGSRETETPRLILSGGQMRLEKRAGGHWIGAQPLPNPLAGVTREGFSGKPKGPPPKRALAGHRGLSVSSVSDFHDGFVGPSVSPAGMQNIHLWTRTARPRAWHRRGLGEKSRNGKNERVNPKVPVLLVRFQGCDLPRVEATPTGVAGGGRPGTAVAGEAPPPHPSGANPDPASSCLPSAPGPGGP